MHTDMAIDRILADVTEICRQTFNDPQLVITAETNAKDVKNWDSITNLVLIDELEKKFGVTFSLDDILNANNIGDLCKTILKLQGSA